MVNMTQNNMNYEDIANIPKDYPVVPKSEVTVKFLRTDERAVLPKYAHNGDMCMDLSTIIDDSDMKPFFMDNSVHTPETISENIIVRKLGEQQYVTLEPGQSLVFHTGLKCSTPKGWGMNIFVRSSMGMKKKIRLCNGTGKVDTAQYRGELLIGLHNYGTKSQKIFSGDRVAQAEIIKIPVVDIIEVTELSSTERGTGGFGSSGGHTA